MATAIGLSTKQTEPVTDVHARVTGKEVPTVFNHTCCRFGGYSVSKRAAVICGVFLSVASLVAVPVGYFAANEMDSSIADAVAAGNFPDHSIANSTLTVFTGVISGLGALFITAIPATVGAVRIYNRHAAKVDQATRVIKEGVEEAEDTV
ncbi:hypothetical protein [Endozoicomonas sp.]|uniref:hypothetical protein n=1 Tax=Endozoicomonas sp. TaxID=1892382 RepID=UPI00288468BB|nr:hypothetical protein [Endozoicomonas sp.]